MSTDDIAVAAAAVRGGGVVGFPTETFYGLGADPHQPAALREVLRLKGRADATKPLLLLATSVDEIAPWVASFPPAFDRLAAHFWPGALTLVLPAAPGVPGPLLGADGGVGVRLTSHPLARRLIEASGTAITGTSANPSGQQAPQSAAQVRAFFGKDLAIVVDGGATPGGQPSTLLQLDGDVARLLRAGAVDVATLRDVVMLV